MKYSISIIAIAALFLFSCNNSKKANDQSDDKQEIQTLIRRVLNWSDSKNVISLLPLITDSRDSVTGFDMKELKENLEVLKATGYFSKEFIENYSQIILTLDKKLKNHEYTTYKAELPSFGFANDVDPWTDAQDDLSWDKVEVEIITLNNKEGKIKWKWGTDAEGDDWRSFRYRFNVKKENGQWKISYMEGFDFKEAIKKDGV